MGYTLNFRPTKKKPSVDDFALDVIRGKYGNGHENRRKAAEAAGLNYDEVKTAVGNKLDAYNGGSSKPSYNKPSQPSTGYYKPTESRVQIGSSPSSADRVYSDAYYKRQNNPDNPRWNEILKYDGQPDEYGAVYNKWGYSQFAHDPNFYLVPDGQEQWVSDYAKWGRNENGTPYREDGSLINYAGNGDSYLRKLKAQGRERIGYDPTGKSDPRDERSTYKPYRNAAIARRYEEAQREAQGQPSNGSNINGGIGGSRPNGGGFGGFGGNPYADLLAQLQNAKKAQLDAAVDRLNQQKAGTGKGFDDLAAQLYAQRMKREELLREQNSDLATGTQDSLDLESKIKYQNDLLDNEYRKQQALAGIDDSINDVLVSGNLQMADDAQKYYLMALQDAQRKAELAEKQRMYDLDRQDRLAKEAKDDAYRNAALAAKGTGTGGGNDASKKMKELRDTATFYYEHGDEESYNKIMDEIRRLTFGDEAVALSTPKPIVISGLRKQYPSAEAAINDLADLVEKGVISEATYNKYVNEFLG